jgi:hypothetical protein
MGSPPTGPNSAPHDFEVQKQIHRQIRNDPDYDDWEYGTEPLPHEAWVDGKPVPGKSASGQQAQVKPASDTPSPGADAVV